MRAESKCPLCGGSGLDIEAPPWVTVAPAGVGRVVLTLDGDDLAIVFTSAPCGQCGGSGAVEIEVGP